MYKRINTLETIYEVDENIISNDESSKLTVK